MWKDTLRKSFRKGWANWPQVEDVRLGSGTKSAIGMNDKVIMYKDHPTPKEQFEKVMEYMEDIQGMQVRAPKDAADIIAESVQEGMILVILGSNQIERAGGNLDETKRICEAIFRWRRRIAKPSFGCLQTEVGGLDQGQQNRDRAQEHITRTRNEVVQHARVLQYIIEAIITREEDFSEQLFLDTHCIFCKEVNHPIYKTPWR